MKKMISKLSKIRRMGFALMVAVALVSCDKEGDVPTQEPEFTQEELAEMAAADKFAAANSIYRALALIDELPDNWESATYTPAEGLPVDEANSDIRNVVSTGADHAKQYFLSIVPDEGLNGDVWSHEGVGTLTFRAVNEENCYAVIDVNLVQMPGLTQLRFVPETMVGENKWEGTPYYGVGDVIVDNKTGIYWICVRPSGGPLAKDKAYFVSFDNSLIKTTTQKQDIYEVTGYGNKTKKTKEKDESHSGNWVYAKNLVEERIAYAAAHVFAMMADGERLKKNDNNTDNKSIYDGFIRKAKFLETVFDPKLLTMGKNTERKLFFVAYGSYQSAAKKYTQVKYIQPHFVFYLDNLFGLPLTQSIEKAWPEYDEETGKAIKKATSSLFSLTDTYDPFVSAAHNIYEDVYDRGPFSVIDYTLDYAPETQFSDLPEDFSRMSMAKGFKTDNVPLVMTQMSLKDHGKPVKGYDLVHVKLDPEEEPDYWGSLAICFRYIFEKGLEEEEQLITE